MHAAIHAQPEAFRDVSVRHAGAAEACASGLSPEGRLFLVGTGTSLHAALIGAHLFRLLGGGLLALPVAAFDFALCGPDLHPQDTVVVLSHRGTKKYSVASRERASAAGCRTALVCGEAAPEPSVSPTSVFPTVPQEGSSAHTVSYVGAIAVLAARASPERHSRSRCRTGTEALDRGRQRARVGADRVGSSASSRLTAGLQPHRRHSAGKASPPRPAAVQDGDGTRGRSRGRASAPHFRGFVEAVKCGWKPARTSAGAMRVASASPAVEAGPTTPAIRWECAARLPFSAASEPEPLGVDISA